MAAVRSEPPPGFPVGHEALMLWFELSYAQFLTVPRVVLEAMPDAWQGQLAALMVEMDATFDWRPKEGRYFRPAARRSGSLRGPAAVELPLRPR